MVSSNRDGDGDHELCSQPSLPKKEYIKLYEDDAVPRSDSARDLVLMPQAKKVATMRDDLERGGQAL